MYYGEFISFPLFEIWERYLRVKNQVFELLTNKKLSSKFAIRINDSFQYVANDDCRHLFDALCFNNENSVDMSVVGSRVCITKTQSIK